MTMAVSTVTVETLLVVAVAIAIIYVSRLLMFKLHPHKHLNLPPGPRPWPILGSLHLLGTHPHRTLTKMAHRYGPVMSIWLGQRLCIVATSPEAAKEFLKIQDANFSARPSFRAVEAIAPNESLVFNDVTPVFRHLRKILVSELTSAKHLRASKHIRTDEMAFMLHSLSRATCPVKLTTFLQTMSTNVLSRMILRKRFLGGDNPSEDKQSEVQEFIEVTKDVGECMGALNVRDYFDFVPVWFDPSGVERRYGRTRERRDAFYASMVAQHREDRRRNPVRDEREKTLLDVLLEQVDVPDLGVTENHVRCVVWDAMAAGTGTTTDTVEWVMAEVLRNPTIIQRARLEMDQIIGCNRIVDESDIPNLKYIHAIVKETFRLHATVPLLIPHQSRTATTAYGYDIPANTKVMVNVWGIGHDPHVWEKPEEFVPERFSDGGMHQGVDFQGQHFELLPFGTGRRACPGLAFGAGMVHLEVANLLHAFDWSFPEGVVPNKMNMTEEQALVIRMKEPLVAVATPRLPMHLYSY